MKIYRLLLLKCLFFLLMSCNGQMKSIDTQPLDLENFDFQTKFSTLIPDSNKMPDVSDRYYEIKSEGLLAHTIYGDGYSIPEEPIRIEYRRISFSYEETLATFAGFNFNAINLVMTLDGKMMVVNALAGEISLKETQRFINLLNKKYGKETKTVEKFMEKPFDIFTWELEDRIIKYCIVHDDESNALKFVLDKENSTIRSGEKEPHFKAYIYLVKKEYANEVIGKMSSGDLHYCR